MTFVYTVLSLAVTGSVLFLLLLALSPVLRKRLPQWAVYMLYMVVLLRLLIPFSPEFSLMHRIYDSSVEYTQAQQNDAESGQAADGSLVLPQGSVRNDAAQTQQLIAADAENISNDSRFPWTAVLFWVWLSGVLILLVRTAVSYALFRRSIAKNSCPIAVDGFDELPVLVVDGISSPMLAGVIRPVILLPGRDMPEWQLKSALKHEAAHYRRGDIPVRWAVELCCAVYWFNPLMPLLRRRLYEACERACDEHVVRDMTETERKLYIRTLVEWAAVQSGHYPLATAMTAGASRLKERLEDAMNYRKTTGAGLLISLAAICIFAAAGLLLGACSADTAHKAEDAAQNSFTDVSGADAEEKEFAAMEEAADISKVTEEELSSEMNDTAAALQEITDMNAALQEVNRYRRQSGLPELIIAAPSDGTGLYEAAMQRLEEIKESFSHTRPDGQDYTSVFAALSDEGSDFVELLGSGHQTAGQVTGAWMEVPHLCEQLLGNLTHMCLVSGQSDDGMVYWVLAAGRF